MSHHRCSWEEGSRFNSAYLGDPEADEVERRLKRMASDYLGGPKAEIRRQGGELLRSVQQKVDEGQKQRVHKCACGWSGFEEELDHAADGCPTCPKCSGRLV